MRLIKKDEQTRKELSKGARKFSESYAALAAAWAKFEFGPFSQQLLFGAVNASPRQVKAEPTGPCQTCAGLITYSSARSFVEDFLVEMAESSGPVMLGSVRVSTAKIRSLIELPAESLIASFDSALQQIKRNIDFKSYCLYSPEDGFTPDLEKIEAQAARGDRYLNPKYEAIYDRLQAFAAEYQALNAELSKFDKEWKLEVMGTGFAREETVFDADKSAYVTTNPLFSNEWTVANMTVTQ